jgi:L-iditol 2-dehydrogenase
MKAVRMPAVSGLRLQDEAVPRSADGEILSRIAAAGIYGSDRIRFIHGGSGDAKLSAPLVLGREFAGVTEDGRRVAVKPAGHPWRAAKGPPFYSSGG